MMPHGNFLSTTLQNLIDMVQKIVLISVVNLSSFKPILPPFQKCCTCWVFKWICNENVISEYSFDGFHLGIKAMLSKYSQPAIMTKIGMTMSRVVKMKQVIHIITILWVEVLTCWYDKEQNDNEQGG